MHWTEVVLDVWFKVFDVPTIDYNNVYSMKSAVLETYRKNPGLLHSIYMPPASILLATYELNDPLPDPNDNIRTDVPPLYLPSNLPSNLRAVLPPYTRIAHTRAAVGTHPSASPPSILPEHPALHWDPGCF